ncbi:MAG TPA: phosphomannomutase/phosphoglucomutase, partial [Methylomirabilota bacterium]|nr:phosphomannomutase/phosphoglucomutase [Methylomirabilota bacterium]
PVVLDCGNGTAGLAAPEIFRKLGCETTVLFGEPDGRFPNHHPDPTVPANLAALIQTVKEKRAAVGIAFDGDSDRIGAVDDEGGIIFGDFLLLLYAIGILKQGPATILSDVKCSGVLSDEVRAHGGKSVMWKTGHSLIKNKMKELSAPLAGEMSGHIFFKDGYYGFDDGIYAAVRLLQVVAHARESLAEMRAALPRVVNTPELRFPCSEDRKFEVVEEVRDRLAAAKADVNAVDGVRVRTKDGWWLLRASNTQDVLVARCEAADAQGLERLKRALAAELEKSGIAAPL